MTSSDNYRNPIPTVDGIIVRDNRIILIDRKNPPFGWALPGGFVDYGESLESAVIREIKEETGLETGVKELFHVYSNPDRDPRQHTVSTVFIMELRSPEADPVAGDDAGDLAFFPLDNLPEVIAFDHRRIIHDFINYKKLGESPNFY